MKRLYSILSIITVASCSCFAQDAVIKPADENNAVLIKSHNQDFVPTEKLKVSKKEAKNFISIFAVKSQSIMSNEDIEINIRANYPKDHTDDLYCINITNKTNDTIYIDKAQCLRIFWDGRKDSYYSPNEEAKVFDIATRSDLIPAPQRIVAIPPHYNRNLSEDRWIKLNKYINLDRAECLGHICNRRNGITQGMVKKGEMLYYTEANTPWTRDFVITYSNDKSFATSYQTKVGIYLHQLLGCSKSYDGMGDLIHYTLGVTETTIMWAYHWFDDYSDEQDYDFTGYVINDKR